MKNDWMNKDDFKNVIFLESFAVHYGMANLVVNGYDVCVSECCGDDAYVVTITKDADEFFCEDSFRNLWEVVEYINHKTLPPEGYIYAAPERGYSDLFPVS